MLEEFGFSMISFDCDIFESYSLLMSRRDLLNYCSLLAQSDRNARQEAVVSRCSLINEIGEGNEREKNLSLSLPVSLQIVA